MIYITGDTHIPFDIKKLSTKRFPAQKEMTADDLLIICGDFGGIWSGSNEELYWRKWLRNKNFTTLFIDGNHENFDLLHTYPVVEFCGGQAHKINDKLYHLMRGHVYTLEGKTFFAFGGAASHDKAYRVERVSWWPEELPNDVELQTALKNLEQAHWQVDYVLTHCAPSSLQQVLSDHPADLLTEFLDEVKEKLRYERWFFGHYHVDKSLDERHTAVYSKLIELLK